jgi:hypothetical protein
VEGIDDETAEVLADGFEATSKFSDQCNDPMTERDPEIAWKYLGEIASDAISAQVDTDDQEPGDAEYCALVDVLEVAPMAGICADAGAWAAETWD